MTKRILIAAGGTGGHVFPASCLAHALKKNEITFATDQRGIKYINSFNQVIIQNIKTTPRTMLYASLLINTLKSFIYLIKNRQNIVIGFGGYASIPFLIAAQSLGIKTVIHEQNAIIGKANKLLSKFAFKIVTSFENTKGLSPSNKIHHIGNPTRFEAEYNIKNTKQNDIFTILIFGGSQGASDFSNDVADAICKISKEHKIKVYHQCPAEELDKTTNKYAAFDIESTVTTFFDNMNEFYLRSDLVISRSGSSSIFEIIGFKKPAILIPYAKSINGDQLENAKFLSNKKAAILFEDNIFNTIKNIMNNKEILSNISNNLKMLYTPNITKKFEKLIEDLV